MCKQCELKGISMPLRPLNIAEVKAAIELPDSWKKLEQMGFHQDLIDRAYAHLGWTMRTGDERWIKNARAFLSSLGKGFLEPFDRSQFNPPNDDPYFGLKTKALDAFDELSNEFGDRVSVVMWNSLAHLATRSEPEKQSSILKEADALPHHFGIVDTMYHALGKVYTFSLRVQSVFFRHTGMVLVHNCDCKCSLLNLMPVDKISGTIHFELDKNGRFEATQSLFTHQCAESHLILDAHLPFEYTITKDAEELFKGINADSKAPA